MGWRHDSAVKSAYCSFRGSKFCSQHPCEVTHNHLSLKTQAELTPLASVAISADLTFTQIQ